LDSYSLLIVYFRRAKVNDFYCKLMLETLYNYFGFVGSLVVSFLVFLFFVFWMAGVAGICSLKRSKHRQFIFFSLAIFVPIYPVLWLIADMIKQRKQLKKL